MVLKTVLFLLLVTVALPYGVVGELVQISDVTIECDPSGIQIVVNSTALEEAIPDLDPDTLHVGRGPWLDQCLPEQAEVASTTSKDLKTFRFAYGECHPNITELTDTKLRLEFEITGNGKSPQSGPAGGTSVSCFVPKDGLIRTTTSDNTNLYHYIGKPEGPLQFGMTIYKDSFMTVPIESEEEIPLGMPLWIHIKMNATGSTEMYVRDCWATPTPSAYSDQAEHIFIKNGIIGEDDETFSPVDDVTTSTSYGFSFDSFMFRGSGSRVYIKCNIHACEQEDIKNNADVCTIPKYPEFDISGRDLSSGSGSGDSFLLQRDLGEKDELAEGNEEDDVTGDSADDDEEEIMQKEFPSFYVMHSFKVKHLERKRRSAGSYRIYPRHTIFSNLRSGITLGIIIASTAMISACAILLPLHLSGEKVRCLHMKPLKRTI